LFRALFLLTTFVMLVNPKLALHLQGNIGNVTQKMLIILTGVALATTRPMYRGVVLLIFAIALLTFVCAVGTEYSAFEWRYYAGGLVSLIAPFALMTGQPEPRDRQLVLQVFAALPVLMTLLGVVYQIVGIAPLFAPDTSLGGMRLSGTQEGPAFLSGAAFVGTVAALELAERRHLGYVALLALDVIVLAVAGGRMAFGAAVFVCGFAYLRNFRRTPLLKLFVPVWAVSLAAGAFLLSGGDMLRHLTSTTLSKRELIWAALQRQLDAHPWFGVGLGHQQLLMPADLKAQGVGTIAGHNEYLRVAVELGYPGAVLFFLLTLGICFLVWNSAWIKRDPMFLVSVAAFYLYTFTDNTLAAPQIYFILTVAAFAGRGDSLAAAPDPRFALAPAAAPASPRLLGSHRFQHLRSRN
jgi:O-antigen ligase